jgi:DNA polymerase I
VLHYNETKFTCRHRTEDNRAFSLQFPVPGQRTEMMRLACCLATQRGVNVVAQVHDALMIEGPADASEEIAARTQEAMAEALAIVLDGFRLRSEANVVRWRDRYMDDRGREFSGRVMALLLCQAESSDRVGSAFGGLTFSVPSATFTRLARC